ncbi:MAG: hypothetical protein WD076_04990 [Parvularculaceae bacterium]
MKFLLSGAVAASALLINTASAGETAQYDLWIATNGAQSLIAVSGAAEGAPFAVAAGPDAAALDLLAGDEASLVLADLKAKATPAPEIVAMANDEPAAEVKKVVKKSKNAKAADKTAEADEAQISKIVLVKKVSAEGDAAATEERRIIKIKTGADASGETIETVIAEAKAEMAASAGEAEIAAEIEKEIAIGSGEEATLIALAGEEGGKVMILETDEDGKNARLVHVVGASAVSARQFIDDAAGLDDAERTEMKSRLGL